MERLVENFIRENQEKEVETNKLTLEIRHDLTVTKMISRRKTTFLGVMGVLSALIVGIAIAGFTDVLDFTPGLFTLTMLQLSWMFIVCDLLRGVHLDVLRARLKYPELYTVDGRYYKRILSNVLLMEEAEKNVNLGEVPEFKKG